jgi:F-type H+-transporting ATPase subunit alpha
MKQKQYSPLSVSEMALSLYAVNEGYIDKVDVAKVGAFEAALHDYAHSHHGDLLEQIDSKGDYSDEIQAGLKTVCDGFAEKGAY